jgi:hypothetical protein
MVQDVKKHHCIEACVGIWNVGAIEGSNRNPGRGSHKHVDSCDRGIRPLLQNELVDCSLAAADVENSRVLWNQTGEVPGENSCSAAENNIPLEHA